LAKLSCFSQKKVADYFCYLAAIIFAWQSCQYCQGFGPDHGRHNTAPALSLPVFSLAIGTFGYSKPIANIANQLTALAILAIAKPIANIANGPHRTRHQARATRHGSLC